MRLLLMLMFGLALAASCSREKSDAGGAAPTPSATGTPQHPAPQAPSSGNAFSAAIPTVPRDLPGSNGAMGSGCAPGPGALPDGVWFGHAVAWDASGIDFDLACFYVGEAAAKEAARRGDESPPPNDFYIVNDNTAVRRVEVATGANGYRLVERGGIVLEATTYKDLVANSGTYQPCPGAWCPIWVFVSGGAATDVMQQYIP